MLAAEGTYDKMEQLLGQGAHPVDILLLLAASEGDTGKIEELLRAGARCVAGNRTGHLNPGCTQLRWDALCL